MRFPSPKWGIPGLLVSLGLAGCQPAPPAASTAANTVPAPQASAIKAVASIQEIMESLVDPAADALWESVSTEVTTKGTVERSPKTPEEWLTLRHQAIALQESANLLLLPGRRVAHPGKDLDDAGTAGNYTAAQVQQAIDTQGPAFAAHAQALQGAATEILAAVDARNVPALVKAGSTLDQACEACHLQFWYPKGGAPAVASVHGGPSASPAKP